MGRSAEGLVPDYAHRKELVVVFTVAGTFSFGWAYLRAPALLRLPEPCRAEFSAEAPRYRGEEES